MHCSTAGSPVLEICITHAVQAQWWRPAPRLGSSQTHPSHGVSASLDRIRSRCHPLVGQLQPAALLLAAAVLPPPQPQPPPCCRLRSGCCFIEALTVHLATGVQLMVFDGACCRYPEMYMLGGPPFRLGKCKRGRPVVIDRDGEEVGLLGDAWCILTELATDDKWAGVQIAYVSRTDEPRELPLLSCPLALPVRPTCRCFGSTCPAVLWLPASTSS